MLNEVEILDILAFFLIFLGKNVHSFSIQYDASCGLFVDIAGLESFLPF
jgi:hypothetical protein